MTEQQSKPAVTAMRDFNFRIWKAARIQVQIDEEVALMKRWALPDAPADSPRARAVRAWQERRLCARSALQAIIEAHTSNPDHERGPAYDFDATRFAEDEFAQDLVRTTGGMSLEEVAAVLGCTRQRVQQIEEAALAKLKRRLPHTPLIDFVQRSRKSAMKRWHKIPDDMRGQIVAYPGTPEQTAAHFGVAIKTVQDIRAKARRTRANTQGAA